MVYVYLSRAFCCPTHKRYFGIGVWLPKLAFDCQKCKIALLILSYMCRLSFLSQRLHYLLCTSWNHVTWGRVSGQTAGTKGLALRSHPAYSLFFQSSPSSWSPLMCWYHAHAKPIFHIHSTFQRDPLFNSPGMSTSTPAMTWGMRGRTTEELLLL